MGEIISVIVPVYNVKDYLAQCIESIICQTYRDLEILLVDDGSTDGCGRICDDYAAKDGRIKVIHKENGGVVSARKTGLSLAKGDWVGYVDGDDWIEPDLYEKLSDSVVKYNADIVMCGRYEDTGGVSREICHGIAGGYYDKERMIAEVYPRMIVNGDFFEWGIFPSVWDKLFRKSVLWEHQMSVDERIKMGEDAACTYPCIIKAERICILQECLYHYRQSSSSMVKRSVSAIEEKENFYALYRSGKAVFEKYRSIYDFREQWRLYMLFLMVPRAGVLYTGIEDLDFLFPFPKVKKGSKVLIYGMGTYGQLLYDFLKSTSFCGVSAAVDQNYEALRAQGIDVVSPLQITDRDYDAIVIACSFAGVRKAVYEDLVRKYGSEKVYKIDVDLIKSGSTLEAFGIDD